MSQAILRVEELKKHYSLGRGRTLKAVDGVSFAVTAGETLGVVGESGCGKTTLGRTVLRLVEATSGRVYFRDRDVYGMSPSELRKARREMQIVFQDPYASLNPRMKVSDVIGEALEAKGVPRKLWIQEAAAVLDKVGLSRTAMCRYPHEFSGGQRQRIGIARALAVGPSLLVCDEPVSALDVSVQSHIINLLSELKREMDLTYLFIAHDLAVVRHISDRVAVMYLGQIVEIAPARSLYAAPQHPYTKALLNAVPNPDPAKRGLRQIISGEIPNPERPPLGCRFHERCPVALDKCRVDIPELKSVGVAHLAACHLVEEVNAND
ncbi:MAG TPA: oligopeptide/dipeptide ABC transporter ATP-binding protein [Bacillota bacterium]|nr:oligopeptide/dipeptide ABC transporter ATP-binding protein [Bacillota bacterium]